MKFFYRFWLAALLASVSLFAQVTASISGKIEDPSGAAVNGAAVTIRSLETGATRTVMTDEAGNYHVESLPLGPQEVKAEKPGFKAEGATGESIWRSARKRW